MSKNLVSVHKEHLYDDEYEGFGGNFIKTKKKPSESVEVKRAKNVTTTRFKPKAYKNHNIEEDYYYD